MKDKIEGKAEELKGRVTGDRATELKGKARQAVGEAKQMARELGVDPAGSRGKDRETADAERSPEPDPGDSGPAGPTRPSDP